MGNEPEAECPLPHGRLPTPMKCPSAARLAAAAFATAAIAACSGDLTGPSAVDRLELAPGSATLSAIGGTQQFTARPLSSSGERVQEVELVWSTADEGVATVDSTGTVTAVGSGTTQLEARVGGAPVTASAGLTVDQEVVAVQVKPDSALVDALGTTREFRTEALDPNGNAVADISATWTTVRPSVATIDTSGTARSQSEGVTGVVGRAAGMADTSKLVVEQRVARVLVSPDSVRAARGDTLDVTGEVVDAAGNAVPGTGLSWSSTDAAVVTVVQSTDSTARAAVVGSGTAEVVAEAPDGTSGAVRVAAGSNLSVGSVFLTPRGVLRDSTVQLGGVITNTGPTDLSSVEWSIRDAGGTTLRSGTLSALPAGASDSLPPQSDLGPFAAGTHRLTLVVDPGDRISETNEGDNTATARLESHPPGYDIELQFVGTVSDSLRTVARSARDRWTRVITGDLEDVAFADSIDLDQCFRATTDAGKRGANIDDLLLMVRSDSIDGEGGALARAGPCFIRTSDTDPGRPPLPLAGGMVVDTADVGGSGGALEEIVIHEIAHVLGFGGLWNVQGGDNTGPYQLREGSDTDDPFFTGPFAIDRFLAIGGSGYDGEPVPVANQGGDGTRNAHWRESVFGTELMTGFINPSVDNPLSVVSIASLADQYYAVDTGAADSFQLSTTSSLVLGASGTAIELGDDRLRVPLFGVTPSGHVRRLRTVPRR